MSEVSNLYEEWIHNSRDSKGLPDERYWKGYMQKERVIYERLLETKTNTIKATVSDFAKDNGLEVFEAVGFFDGISEALNVEIDFEKIEETTEIDASFDFEDLFQKMVEYKAKHLFSLPQWENIIDPERQKELAKEQRQSGTVVKDKKVNRNDSCPCESGKKYKKCCGFND